MKNQGKVGAVLVIGGGIGGVQASLDLADSGYKVYLLDKGGSIGGTMAQLDKTFPTNDCSMCILAPKLVDAGRHQNIQLVTLSEVEKLEGEPGNFKVKVKRHPRFVDETKCTGCGVCWNNCPVQNKPVIPEERLEVVLSEEDKDRMNDILKKNKGSIETLVPILQDVNTAYRYLPAHILMYISFVRDVPLSQVYNIATFYNAFSLEPKGESIISVCLGTACHVKGAPKIIEALERELGIKAGKTTEDMKFSLEAVRCLGCCGLAPVMTIGEDVYGKVTQNKISKILAKY